MKAKERLQRALENQTRYGNDNRYSVIVDGNVLRKSVPWFIALMFAQSNGRGVRNWESNRTWFNHKQTSVAEIVPVAAN